jgi:hypothetical protein
LPVSFFTGKHDNRPKVRHLAWDALAKRLSTFQAREEKDGPLWSPAAYDVHKDARRAKGQVRTVSCAVFDFDHAEPPREHLEQLRVVHLVHSTHSHLTVCPDNPSGDPRYRVVVPFRRPVVVDGDRDGRWYALWLRLRHHLAPGAVLDESCKDASRMYYDPACRPGAEHYIDLLDGEGVEFLDPSAVPELPPDVAAAVRAKRAAPLGDDEGWIEAGDRHGALLSLAGTMRDRGAGEETIRAALLAMNTAQCRPPKSENEVEGIVRFVMTKAVGTAGAAVRTEASPALEVVAELPPDTAPPDADAPPTPHPAETEQEAPPGPRQGKRSPSPGSARRAPPKAPTISPMAEVWNRDFPEPQDIVPGMVPEGLSLLIGRAKLGKSMIAMQCAAAVATAAAHPLGTTDESRKVAGGRVLYLDLENGPRRTQKRLKMVFGDDFDPDSLPHPMDIATEWPVGDAGVEYLRTYLAGHDDTRLVVIDTLKRVRPPESGQGGRLYDLDYDALAPYADLAHEYPRLAIVVIHHSKKGDASDVVDLASGSTGLTAAVDAILIWRRRRDRQEGRLFVTDRDREEVQQVLSWDVQINGWRWGDTVGADVEDEPAEAGRDGRAGGRAEPPSPSQSRAAILALLSGVGRPLRPVEIASFVHKTPNLVNVLLWKMGQDGEVRRVAERVGDDGEPEQGSFYTTTAPTINGAQPSLLDFGVKGVKTVNGPASPSGGEGNPTINDTINGINASWPTINASGTGVNAPVNAPTRREGETINGINGINAENTIDTGNGPSDGVDEVFEEEADDDE